MSTESSPDDLRRAYIYPAHWEADVVLSDGGTVHMRPIVPNDAEALREFHAKLSERTRYFRYFGPYPRIPDKDLRRFTTVDHSGRVAFVATLGGEIISVGRYERLDDGDSAEVAFVVADAHQGRGLGSILLEHLAAAARENGFRRFVAEVLAENATMVRVFRDAGYQVSRAIEEGVLHLEFDIDPTKASISVARAREQAAEARSVHNLLHPRAVAVIGASADPTKVGYVVFTNLLSASFAGTVYPVNSEHSSVRGVRAYASVVDIPDPVDLAVVAVPASGMDEVLDACLAKGVTTLVVVSSGFSDAGPRGKEAERRMVAEARAHGMRVVGPNALGVINTDPRLRLNATLATTLPAHGRVGFFCQSGALGTAILADAAERGLGLSTFVSAGNRADVSGNDLLQYWETDPETDVVLLYLESFGNPRKFGRLARRLARHKPVIAVKSGRHTTRPALTPTSVPLEDAGVARLFEQAGVIRVETIAQLFDTALLLANQPLPRGNRLAVVGNSTAIGVLAADTARDGGLELAREPIDTGAQPTPEDFAEAVRSVLADEQVDALVVVFVPPIAIPTAAYAAALRTVVDETEQAKVKPIVSTFVGAEGMPEQLAIGDGAVGSIPSYPSPERATRALVRANTYARWREQPRGEHLRPAGIDTDAGAGIVHSALAESDAAETELSEQRAQDLLAAYGIEIEPYRVVGTEQEAEQAAAELGYPVVLKQAAFGEVPLAELADVRLDITGAADLRAAYRSLRETGADGQLYVQRMAPRGHSCLFSVQDDPSFGSVLAFGLSGPVSDLVGDRAYRAVPLSDVDARWLIRAPRTAPLLTGWRGRKPVDTAALEELALRCSALAEDLPQVRSLLLDPVIVTAQGARVARGRIILGLPELAADEGPRRLGSYRTNE
ncbi:bifunctional GNAT family N-acetyltransferase/acetate--CoA ligase family protein [Sciscionella sediminilitoris]|uniref:bifunctional acetate--CoA ligase family protein/GNAT family N-acetyltransferase n=1 Tax=Sciscionella sediminilitoris TaxID=1445613 RepID=UPI0004DF2405|nr:bifunctional GNAT family N-acetyltransferase/acetate--CoA ligase family protein [Sciscionella sp. SE31]